VTKYDIQHGRLELEHNFPPSISSTKNTKNKTRRSSAKVLVDVYHVLDTIKADELEVGAWLNIFGYVRSGETKDDAVYVQAVMVSDAGAIRVAEYEQSVSDMQAINRRLRRDV
jgi:Telomere capping, CST complex subunit